MTRVRRLLRIAKWLYASLVIAFLAWTVLRVGAQSQDWSRWLAEPAAYGFIFCWMLTAFSLGAAWSNVLSIYLGIHLKLADWLPIQAVAWAGRYLPGKIGLMAGKLALLERPDTQIKPLAFSVLFEQLAFVVAGSVLALAFGPLLEVLTTLGLDSAGSVWWRWGVAIVLTVAFFPLLHLVAARMRVSQRPRILEGLMLAGGYMFAHAVAGLGLYFVLWTILPDTALSLLYTVGLLAAANVAGIAAVFAPAGIGVRELVLALGLSPFMAFDEALALAAILRVLTVIADLLFAATGGVGSLLFGRR